MCIPVYKALKDLFEIHEMLCVVYISLWPFLIERGHKGHRAFTTFSKPAPRHGPGHIPLKYWRLVGLVGLVISGYVHNQIFRIRRCNVGLRLGECHLCWASCDQ